MNCFLDGSCGQSDSSDEWITLAGFAGPDAVWADFDDRWNRMRLERYPIALYVHMIEMLDGDDPFDRVNGWTEHKLEQLVADALVVMNDTGKDKFRALRFSFNNSARERIQAEGRKALDPYSLCAKGCAAFALGWHNQSQADPESIFLYFDRNEKFIQPLKKAWLASRTPPGRPKSAENVWDRFGNMIEDDMKNQPGLQAADMLAWGTTRTLSDKERLFSSLKSRIHECVNQTEMSISEGVMRGTERLVLLNNGVPTVI
jgi:hypothetical protein